MTGTQRIPRAALDWHLVWLDFDLLSYRREPHRTAVVMGLLGVLILSLVASRLAVTVGEYCCLPMLIRCKIYYDILDTDMSIYLSVCLSNLIQFSSIPSHPIPSIYLYTNIQRKSHLIWLHLHVPKTCSYREVPILCYRTSLLTPFPRHGTFIIPNFRTPFHPMVPFHAPQFLIPYRAASIATNPCRGDAHFSILVVSTHCCFLGYLLRFYPPEIKSGKNDTPT